MKKILLFAVVAAMLFLFAACNGSGTKKADLDPNISQSDLNAKQQSVIDTFGVSIENSSIVGYKFVDEYLEYIVVNYKDGKKTAKHAVDEPCTRSRGRGDVIGRHEEGAEHKTARKQACRHKPWQGICRKPYLRQRETIFPC